MSFTLYVGNYPCNFSRKDIADVFKEFDDIKVENFIKKEKKCYSFLLCKDIDQMVSVIRQMNNAIVSGRKLIVRARDDKLQEYVELMLREAEVSLPASAEPLRRKERFTNAESPPYVPLQVLKQEVFKHQNAPASDFDEKWDTRSCSSTSNYSEKHFSDHKSHSASANSYKHQRQHFSSDQDDVSELCWVSVTNFPLGTSKRALFDLFSDYEPIDVMIICNQARKDKAITEAFVAFLNQEMADDVILNFDNTLFKGRILLVNDIDDLTVMNELMNGLKL